MISKEDLKKNNILGYLEDDMLDKLIPLIKVQKFEEMENIYKGEDEAENFFMLKKGKIILEQRITELMTVSVETITPGQSFGWASIIGENVYTIDAMCVEPSEVFVVNRDVILDVLEGDHVLGYKMMKIIVYVLKERMNRTTGQFVRAITAHPEIHTLE